MDIESSLGLLFIVFTIGVIAAGFGWTFFRDNSEWNRVRAQFPAYSQGVILAKYKKSISRIGRREFESDKGSVSVTGAGFLLEMTNPFIEGIFIPYEQVQNVRRSSLFGHHFVRVGCGYDMNTRETMVDLTLPGKSWDVLMPYIDQKVVTLGRNLNSVGELVSFTKETIETAKNKPPDLEKY